MKNGLCRAMPVFFVAFDQTFMDEAENPILSIDIFLAR